mgnify:CR=1 FL=1
MGKVLPQRDHEKRGLRKVPIRYSKSLILLFFLLLSATCLASGGSLEGRVVEHTLKNGMHLLMLPRTGAPVVTLQITFKVGSVDEVEGKTGMAHLFEHMLFKGTTTLGTSDWEAERPIIEEIEAVGEELDALRAAGEGESERSRALLEELAKLQESERRYIVKDEIDAIYSRNGGTGFNAFTTPDMTSYIVSLPAGRVELWASIESARMRDPVLREFYVERDVVKEERRQRREGEPVARMMEELKAAAFTTHPYRNPVIGWPGDLDTLSVKDTRAFYKKYYGPDNAVVTAVGDINPDDFIALCERYFGPIPSSGFRRYPLPSEPKQTEARRVELKLDAEPIAILAYHKPTLPHRDDYVLDVVDGILSYGRSSRLVRSLVEEKKVLTSVSTQNGSPGARYDNLFLLYAEPAPGVTADEALKALREELALLAAIPPTREELERVVRKMEADMVRSLLSDGGLSRRLSYFQTVAGDWRYAEENPRILKTVTPEEVSAVCAKYFAPENETAVLLIPTGGEG